MKDNLEWPGMSATPIGTRKIGKWRIGPFFQIDPYHGTSNCIGFVAVKPSGEYLTETVTYPPFNYPVEMLRLFPTLDDALRTVRPLAARALIRAI